MEHTPTYGSPRYTITVNGQSTQFAPVPVSEPSQDSLEIDRMISEGGGQYE